MWIASLFLLAIHTASASEADEGDPYFCASRPVERSAPRRLKDRELEALLETDWLPEHITQSPLEPDGLNLAGLFVADGYRLDREQVLQVFRRYGASARASAESRALATAADDQSLQTWLLAFTQTTAGAVTDPRIRELDQRSRGAKDRAASAFRDAICMYNRGRAEETRLREWEYGAAELGSVLMEFANRDTDLYVLVSDERTSKEIAEQSKQRPELAAIQGGRVGPTAPFVDPPTSRCVVYVASANVGTVRVRSSIGCGDRPEGRSASPSVQDNEDPLPSARELLAIPDPEVRIQWLSAASKGGDPEVQERARVTILVLQALSNGKLSSDMEVVLVTNALSTELGQRIRAVDRARRLSR